MYREYAAVGSVVTPMLNNRGNQVTVPYVMDARGRWRFFPARPPRDAVTRTELRGVQTIRAGRKATSIEEKRAMFREAPPAMH
jgi:hypothetical protein